MMQRFDFIYVERLVIFNIGNITWLHWSIPKSSNIFLAYVF
jgi:hypothetical protein